MKSRRMMFLVVLLAVLAGAVTWEFWPGAETGISSSAQTKPETSAANKTVPAKTASGHPSNPAPSAPKTPQFIEVKAWVYETTTGPPGLQYTFDPMKFAQSPPTGVKIVADSTALLKNNGRVIVYSGPDGLGVTTGNYTQTEPGMVVGIEPGDEDDTLNLGVMQVSGKDSRVEFDQNGAVLLMGGTLGVGSSESLGSGEIIMAGGGLQWSANTTPSVQYTPFATGTGSAEGGKLKLVPGDNPGKNSLVVDFGSHGTGPQRFAVLSFQILSPEEAAKLPPEAPETN